MPQRCLEQGFVRAVICRNGTQARQQQHLPSNTCVPGQAAASSGGQMLPAESGTLPHRPWTPMSLVNGRHRKRSAAGGWSEAEVCAEELPLRGRPCMEDNAAASGSSCELANPAQVRQIASQTGVLLCRMRFVAGRGAVAELLAGSRRKALRHKKRE